MAELIDRNKLLSILEKYKFGGISSDIERDFIKESVIGFVKCMPTVTTTEAEIRAKAYERFMKEIEAEYDNDACPNVADYLDYKISLRDLFRIAEQLKEEQ